MSIGDGPFIVIANVGTYAFKLELPGDVNVLATFNVADLSLYVEDDINFEDLKANPL